MSESSNYEPDEDESDSEFEENDASDQDLSGEELRKSSPEDEGPGDDWQGPQQRYAAYDERAQKLPPHSLQTYTQLVSEIEYDIQFAVVKESDEIHYVTQNGAVVWTATEKEVLFNMLDRKGRNGIKEIAAAIGTKSELEVIDHLQLLHRGMESHHMLDPRARAVAMSEIPAAAEISKEGCDMLDEYAELATIQEELALGTVQRVRHANNWIISDVQAEKLLEACDNGTGRHGVHLAAGLLNVPTWIQLSRRFFMNFGSPREEDHWTNFITSKDEAPAMTADSLLDFYALVVSITRRVIQSSIFFALARLRSTERPGRQRINAVRRTDVRIALEVLNMKHDRGEWLMELARRNNLIIADIHNRKDWVPRVFSYDEAEKILRGNDDYFRRSRSGALSDGISTEGEGGEEDEEADDEDYEEGDGEEEDEENDEEEESKGTANNPTPTVDTSDPYQASSELSSPAVSDEDASDPELLITDAQDRESSRREELSLWQILGHPAPPKFLHEPIQTIEDDDLKDAARGRRKTKHEMADWRARTLYRADWEEYGHGLTAVEADLVENRSKRRRVDGLEGSGGGDDYDDDGRVSSTSPVISFSAARVDEADDLSEEDLEGGRMDVDEEVVPGVNST